MVATPLFGFRLPVPLYLAGLAILLALSACGVFLVISRYQKCPCPICSGKYVTTKVLGKGGFGTVWLAHKRNDEGMVYAIKMLSVTDISTANEGVEEATTVAMCSHRNLVSLDGQFFHSERGFKAFWAKS